MDTNLSAGPEDTDTRSSVPGTQHRISVGAERGRRSTAEAAVDEEWLRWIAQHRFVGVDALIGRFGVSRAATWRRLQRLVNANLLIRKRAGATTIVYLAARAMRLLGLPRRKPPRAPLASLAHNLAIARWHAALDRAASEQRTGAHVLTERGLRDRHTPSRPYCAFVAAGGGRTLQRWADVAVELPNGRLQPRIAAVAADDRVQARSGLLGELEFVGVPALGRRIAQLVAYESAHPAIVVQPWFDVEQPVADEIRRRVASITATLPGST